MNTFTCVLGSDTEGEQGRSIGTTRRQTYLKGIGKIEQHVRCLLVPTHNVKADCNDVLSLAALYKSVFDGQLEIAVGRVNVVCLEGKRCRELGNAFPPVVDGHHA